MVEESSQKGDDCDILYFDLTCPSRVPMMVSELTRTCCACMWKQQANDHEEEEQKRPVSEVY